MLRLLLAIISQHTKNEQKKNSRERDKNGLFSGTKYNLNDLLMVIQKLLARNAIYEKVLNRNVRFRTTKTETTATTKTRKMQTND